MNTICAELRQYTNDFQLHHHDHHQIVLPKRGTLDLEISQRGGLVAQGVGAFIVAGETHAFSAKYDNSFVVADLPVDHTMTPRHVFERFQMSPFFAIGPEAQGLIDYLAERLVRGAVPVNTLGAWGRLLLDALVIRSDAPDCRRNTVDQALAFMRRHLAGPIAAADIAAACGVSQSRLYPLFRETTGRTPHEMLSNLRLEMARRLLARTELSIAEIAVRTGHADQSVLTRRLRTADGITPAAFRRKARSIVGPQGSA